VSPWRSERRSTPSTSIADADRTYETLARCGWRAIRRVEEYLLSRVLAYAMEHTDGIAFPRRSVGFRPAIAIRI
jgi:hypothetical protein